MNEMVTTSALQIAERYEKTIREMAEASCRHLSEEEWQAYKSLYQTLRLNPLRKQIHIWRDWDGKVVYHVGIDGFRAVANSTGDYRPDPTGGEWEVDDALKGPTNPAGLISATFAGEKYIHGEWTPHPTPFIGMPTFRSSRAPSSKAHVGKRILTACS